MHFTPFLTFLLLHALCAHARPPLPDGSVQEASPVVRAAASAHPWPTTVWSTVLTTSGFVQFVNPRHYTNLETLSVTTVLPVSTATITSYPTGITQTVISHMTYDERTTYDKDYGSESTSTRLWSTLYTDLQTYVLARPRATGDLPAGIGPDDLPCDQCPPADADTTSAVQDSRCAAKGLHTGCQGQCEQRAEGVWWCFVLHTWEYGDASLRTGRGRAGAGTCSMSS